MLIFLTEFVSYCTDIITELVITLVRFYTELVLAGLRFLSELVLTALRFLMELFLTALRFLTGLVFTVLRFLTELILTLLSQVDEIVYDSAHVHHQGRWYDIWLRHQRGGRRDRGLSYQPRREGESSPRMPAGGLRLWLPARQGH